MNYPFWQLNIFGGGFFIAFIAVIHVYISHFAVGGGLFLVLTEMKGLKENNPDIILFVRKHTRFFLLLTMVAGSLTGVGIWFSISLLNPAATSLLIHNFVFSWGIEWVFFLGEVISLFIYYYTFDKLSNRHHVTIGWIYFGCGIGSLFFINGIIGFMLTPGNWLQNHGFWSGFFNPTFWPSLFFRGFLAIMLAGLFGFTTTTFLKDSDLKNRLVRYCSIWLLAPFFLLILAAWWYKSSLPPELQIAIFQRFPELRPYISGFTILSSILLLAGLIMAIKIPSLISRPVAGIMLLVGLLYMGSFEFIREGGRKPYIIHGYMYANSILKKDVAEIKVQGVLQNAKWVKNKTITAENRLETGKELFQVLCLSCHSIGGPINNIKKVAVYYNEKQLNTMLSTVHQNFPYMPPFAGNDKERKALAHYVTHALK